MIDTPMLHALADAQNRFGIHDAREILQWLHETRGVYLSKWSDEEQALVSTGVSIDDWLNQYLTEVAGIDHAACERERRLLLAELP